MYTISKDKNKFELFHRLAAVITLGNFILMSFANVVKAPHFIVLSPIESQPVQIILFLILESTLAYIFGGYLVQASIFLAKTTKIIMLFIIGFISAWVSIFNVSWIFNLTLKSAGTYTLMSFLVCYLFATIIAIAYIREHIEEKNISKSEYIMSKNDIIIVYTIQVFCFAYTLIQKYLL